MRVVIGNISDFVGDVSEARADLRAARGAEHVAHLQEEHAKALQEAEHHETQRVQAMLRAAKIEAQIEQLQPQSSRGLRAPASGGFYYERILGPRRRRLAREAAAEQEMFDADGLTP